MYRAKPGSRRLHVVRHRLTAPLSGAIAMVGGVTACVGLALFGKLTVSWLSLAVFAVLAAGIGVFSPLRAVPAVAGGAWLIYNGFIELPFGELVWTDPGAQAARISLLGGAALVTALPGALPRRRVRIQILTPSGRPVGNRRPR